MSIIFSLLPLPFTRLLMIVTTTTILTIVALMLDCTLAIPLAYACALCVLLTTSHQKYTPVVIWCLLFSVATTLQMQHLHHAYQSHQDLLHHPVTIQGTIASVQEISLHKKQNNIVLQTTSIDNQLITKNLYLFAPAHLSKKLVVGSQVSIEHLALDQPALTDEFAQFLIKENMWATGFLAGQKIKIINKGELPGRWTWLKLFSKQLTAQVKLLFNPLFLGKREKNHDMITLQHNSLYWGIAHHMARSGIHLVTIFGLFMTLFHYLRLRSSYRFLLSALIISGYFQYTFTSISMVRALCMILFQIFSKLHAFNYSSIHALTTTTLMVLVCNPFQLFFLDFQLSFAITAIIIWLFQAKYAKTVAFQPKALIAS